MPRLLFALALLITSSLFVFAGDDPAVKAREIGKKFSMLQTITEFSIKPLIGANEDVRKEFFKAIDDMRLSEAHRVNLCSYAARKDPSEEVRVTALHWLGKVKDKSVSARVLSDLLADKSPAIRQAAAEGLIGYRGDPALSVKFGKMIYDPSKDVRQAAVRALGKLGDRKQVPAIMAAYKKFKAGADDDAPFGEALAQLGENDLSLEIARVSIKSRNLPSRMSAAVALECNPSLKVIPIIMENLALELRRTITQDPKKSDWDAVYVTMCSELIRRTGTSYDNDAVGWYKWWSGVREKYQAPAPVFDEKIVAGWMDTYRKMGPSKVRQ